MLALMSSQACNVDITDVMQHNLHNTVITVLPTVIFSNSGFVLVLRTKSNDFHKYC
jgi:hypothetical protein